MTQNGPLHNIRILDLSRVLAGPSCTQILGDLGADIIKVERPGFGDDTRKWGPPFTKDADGNDTTESAYYLSANRNKRSITIDITQPEGQKLIHSLIEKSDILIENFKVGNLAKYGLGYDQIKDKYPSLIYASITGFGQTGPLAKEPGYDLLAQAMSGLMSVTGEVDGQPMKAGIAISDFMTGLYSAIGILSALHHRTQTGRGQHVDTALLDCTMASMTNIAQYYLTSGDLAPRRGNAHSTIVPYQVFETKDGHVILSVGNDSQFKRFCDFIGKVEWADTPSYATNFARLKNRETLIPMIEEVMRTRNSADWINGLKKIDVPVSPVNNTGQAFEMEQTKQRDMTVDLHHTPSGQTIKTVGSPLKLSETKVSYRKAPPSCGEHTDEILKDILELDEGQIQTLKTKGVL